VVGKPLVRKANEKASGREGVVKWGQDPRPERREVPPHLVQRFRDEAKNMERLNGTQGILPVWDIDHDQPDAPRWYAMPLGKLLDDHLGDDATLREVVEHVAFLADTLAGLAQANNFHRDVRPANLLWWDGHPVLADFGIAVWDAGAQSGLTRPGDKIGAANFIDPEMRHRCPAQPGKRADVYSLAKTLFVLAVPGRGPYPPDGTHRGADTSSHYGRPAVA